MKRALHRPVIGVTVLPAVCKVCNETPEPYGTTPPLHNKSREGELSTYNTHHFSFNNSKK